jgi:hypothetical protein
LVSAQDYWRVDRLLVVWMSAENRRSQQVAQMQTRSALSTRPQQSQNALFVSCELAVAPVHYNTLPIQPASRSQDVMVGLTTLFDQAGAPRQGRQHAFAHTRGQSEAFMVEAAQPNTGAWMRAASHGAQSQLLQVQRPRPQWHKRRRSALAVLKATTRRGLLNWPISRSVTTLAKLAC